MNNDTAKAPKTTSSSFLGRRFVWSKSVASAAICRSFMVLNGSKKVDGRPLKNKNTCCRQFTELKDLQQVLRCEGGGHGCSEGPAFLKRQTEQFHPWIQRMMTWMSEVLHHHSKTSSDGIAIVRVIAAVGSSDVRRHALSVPSPTHFSVPSPSASPLHTHRISRNVIALSSLLDASRQILSTP